jgi:hypothetical protein
MRDIAHTYLQVPIIIALTRVHMLKMYVSAVSVQMALFSCSITYIPDVVGGC